MDHHYVTPTELTDMVGRYRQSDDDRRLEPKKKMRIALKFGGEEK